MEIICTYIFLTIAQISPKGKLPFYQFLYGFSDNCVVFPAHGKVQCQHFCQIFSATPVAHRLIEPCSRKHGVLK
jgi:hypothetical protein